MLNVQHISKRYGEAFALRDLSLELGAGQFCALLGPNGAGKSTLFQILTGLFVPDQGEVMIDAQAMRVNPSRLLAKIGVVFQQMSLDLDLSVRSNLQFAADLHGLPRSLAKERIAQGCESLGLSQDLPRAVRELSGGNRRKVELVRALLHAPRLLLMDEPTVGLDPQSRRDLLATVRTAVAEKNLSVLWATHLVEEAQQADRVLVLHQGQLLADGSPQAVAQALGGGSLEEAFIGATKAKRGAMQASKEMV